MLRLFGAEFRRGWILFTRYPTEAITTLLSMCAIFLFLFLGGRYLAGSASGFGQRLDSIIVGYLLWTLTLFALGTMGWNIQEEAQTGTLEQVYLSPFGPSKVFLIRAVANLVLQLIVIGAVLLVIQIVTGRHLHFSLLIAFPIITILMATYGLAFILGGMTLVFKRIQNVLQLSQFALVFLVVTPVEHWSGSLRWIGYIMPMSVGSGVLRNMMAKGMPLDFYQWGISFLNGIFYLLLGALIFNFADKEAKKGGLIGGY